MADRNLENAALKIFRTLDKKDKQLIIRFAKFLHLEKSTQHESKTSVTAPVKIPRPRIESVVSAIKRLRKTYPMLEADVLMNEAAEQMTAHLVKGKKAADAIDELEVIFYHKYQEIKNV